MKGILIILLGIILIAACAYAYRFWNIDGAACGWIAFLVGGGAVTSGINLTYREAGFESDSDD